MPVKPIPAGYRSVAPYLMVRDASRLIAFLLATFAGEAAEVERLEHGGRISHAEVRIGDSIVMMGEPVERDPTPAAVYVYVPDVDAAHARALAAGGTSVSPPAETYYGDRSGGVTDPEGNTWWIATHVEDVPPDELRRRHVAEMERRAAAKASG